MPFNTTKLQTKRRTPIIRLFLICEWFVYNYILQLGDGGQSNITESTFVKNTAYFSGGHQSWEVLYYQEILLGKVCPKIHNYYRR